MSMLCRRWSAESMRRACAPARPRYCTNATANLGSVDVLDRALGVLASRPIVALTGAGLSTDSGIPDYRGPGSPNRTPMTYQEFLSGEVAQRRYWARSHVGWARMAHAAPNAGHRALAALERSGALHGLITQNVDGLHEPAGSTACGGALKPDVVFFGENVPRERVARAYTMVDAAAALLVAGSSLTVMSGLRFVRHAHKAGIPVVIVNRGATRGDELAAVLVNGGCSETLSEVAAAASTAA